MKHRNIYKNLTKIFICFWLILTLCFAVGCSFIEYVFEAFDPYYYDLDIEGNFAVHFIDVGQGDSILIQSPENEFMLIDTGESDQYTKLSSYLSHYKVKEFKYVIFTHPHSDHIGSADKIVKKYKIETLIMSYLPDEMVPTTNSFRRLITEIENKNLEITPAEPGETFKFGNAEFMIIGPQPNEYGNLNNYSVVIKMTYGETSFLLTGDMEKDSENDVIEYIKENNIDISADVMKAAHHGSSTSSQAKFLGYADPSFAVIFCGKDNPYNHPNLKTAERLKNAGAEIYRTDLDSDIVVISDGTFLSIAKGRK